MVLIASAGHRLTQAIALEDEGQRIYVKMVDGEPNDWVEVDEQEVAESLLNRTNHLQTAIDNKIAVISAYDKSEAVNSFELAGHKMWYSKEDRAGLVRALDRADANGMTTFDMWYGDAHYELPVALMRQMVDAVEDYAIQCLCVTEHHKANVMALTSVEDVKNYDHKAGYPQKLVFLPLPI